MDAQRLAHLSRTATSLIILAILLVTYTGCQRAIAAHHSIYPSRSSAAVSVRSQLVDRASQTLGAAYTYGGTSPRQGFDCSGFTQYILQSARVSLPHQSAAQARTGTKIRPAEAQPGDLVYFARGGRIFHVALVVRNDAQGMEVIHSTSSRGVIRENITRSSYWQPKLAGARDVLTGRQLVQR